MVDFALWNELQFQACVGFVCGLDFNFKSVVDFVVWARHQFEAVVDLASWTKLQFQACGRLSFMVQTSISSLWWSLLRGLGFNYKPTVDLAS